MMPIKSSFALRFNDHSRRAVEPQYRSSGWIKLNIIIYLNVVICYTPLITKTFFYIWQDRINITALLNGVKIICGRSSSCNTSQIAG